MHGPINVKSPNNTSKWQMGFHSALKGLNTIQDLLSLSSISDFISFYISFVILIERGLSAEFLRFRCACCKDCLNAE
jgi:hypothetical protein